MSGTSLLRIEGVNLSQFVFDTRDLSTIRGGSLRLLDAIPLVKRFLEESGFKLSCLTEGASTGLFEILSGAPEAATTKARAYLQEKFPHATFVVDVVQASTNFRKDLEQVLAANRWRQLQACSLAVPPKSEVNTRTEGTPACGLDGVRPASHQRVREVRVSESVWHRRKYGREKKHTFYERVLTNESAGKFQFASDFEEIASGVPLLNGKLALFYADGNAFGKVQEECCIDANKQEQWDKFVRIRREKFLSDFLSKEILPVKADTRWRNGDGSTGAIRFETLLWGGDELMFVMPACFGWRFARHFFESFADFNLAGAGDVFPNKKLTHTASLVYCHHHAPIERIKRLAKDGLADFAKDLDGGREHNQLVVVALESFDHLGMSYGAALDRRYGGKLKPVETVFRCSNSKGLHASLADFAECVKILRDPGSDFARSKLRERAHAIVNGKEASERPDPLKNASDAVRKAIANLKATWTAGDAMWIQLEEFWDYALP